MSTCGRYRPDWGAYSRWQVDGYWESDQESRQLLLKNLTKIALFWALKTCFQWQKGALKSDCQTKLLSWVTNRPEIGRSGAATVTLLVVLDVLRQNRYHQLFYEQPA